jgi:DNA-binding IscR family transcriptional regulator
MSEQLTPAAVRYQIEQRKQERIRKRILGLRAAHRTMPVKEIAYRVGVSADYVEQVLAQAAGPR